MAIKKSKNKRTKKKAVSKRAAPKKMAAKTKTSSKNASPKKAARKKNQSRGKSETTEGGVCGSQKQTPRSGALAGDLQGLSDVPEANSESVDELLEEGNALEAEVVKGVEDAPD